MQPLTRSGNSPPCRIGTPIWRLFSARVELWSQVRASRTEITKHRRPSRFLPLSPEVTVLAVPAQTSTDDARNASPNAPPSRTSVMVRLWIPAETIQIDVRTVHRLCRIHIVVLQPPGRPPPLFLRRAPRRMLVFLIDGDVRRVGMRRVTVRRRNALNQPE